MRLKREARLLLRMYRKKKGDGLLAGLLALTLMSVCVCLLLLGRVFCLFFMLRRFLASRTKLERFSVGYLFPI